MIRIKNSAVSDDVTKLRRGWNDEKQGLADEIRGCNGEIRRLDDEN